MASSYLEGYGVDEAKRNRVIRYIILGALAATILAVVGYFVLHDYSEKQVAKKFLAQLNAHDFKGAYSTWCPTPCAHYDYGRFSTDWVEKKLNSPWKIDSVDSCKAFLTVNVTADGAELQSLSVERGTDLLSYAPAPECQEYKWHWKQFFQRLFGSSGSG